MSIFHDIVETDSRLERYGIGRGRLCYLVSEDEWLSLLKSLEELSFKPQIIETSEFKSIMVGRLQVRKE